jgi:hypothetical protein
MHKPGLHLEVFCPKAAFAVFGWDGHRLGRGLDGDPANTEAGDR